MDDDAHHASTPEAAGSPPASEQPNLAQGSLFLPVQANLFLSAEADAANQEPACMLLVTHDCDLWRDDDVTVEALACYPYPVQHPQLPNWIRSSPRRFPLGTLYEDAALVAHADRRVIYEKAELASFTSFPYEIAPERRKALKRWLGKRFNRPAHPNEFEHQIGTPLQATFQGRKGNKAKWAEFHAAVGEIRFTKRLLADGREEVLLIYLVNGVGLSEVQREAIAYAHDQACSAVSEKTPSNYWLSDHTAVNLGDVPYGVILRSDLLNLDPLSTKEGTAQRLEE